MTPDIAHVALAFCAGAAILAVPAMAGLLFALTLGIRLWRQPATPASAPVRNPDAILLMLGGITRVATAIGGVVGFAGRLLAIVLTLASVVALLVAGVLYATGRGLQEHEDGARGLAAAITGGLLLMSGVSLTMARRLWRLLCVALIAAEVYALAALWHGYGG